MLNHTVRVYPSKETLERQDQLAWKIAAVATDPVAIEPAVVDMVVNRIVDNAAVAVAALNRSPVAAARAQALAHPREGGAAVFGIASDRRFAAEWAAWANGTAVRELDFHDTFLAADYSHPGDNIPAILAVAQQTGRGGEDLVRGIATAYEIQIDLVKGICLHAHKIDHIAHLGPSAAADWAPCSGSRPRRSTRRSSRRFIPPSARGSRARGRFQAGRRSRPLTRANSRSRRWTARCGARARRRRSTRARTA